MPVIDADTHVDENEDTWTYLANSERQYAPATIDQQAQMEGQVAPGYNRYWLIDGQLRVRRVRDDQRTGTVQATRELHDVPGRLNHMDQLGVDVHILYPTLFLAQVSGKPEIERALCRAYNRWLADRCSESKGRLRWLAVLPTLDMSAVLEEIRFARDHGAAGVMKKGIDGGMRPASDPYFYPLYAAASEAGLAVCFHLGTSDPNLPDTSRSASSMWHTVLPVVDACSSLVTGGIPSRFPELRVGFIEAGAGWVPYVLTDLWARHERLAWAGTFDLKEDVFRECRFFVACQTQEDINYLREHGLEDSLLIGSDYSHADMSAELDALGVMRRRAESGELDRSLVRKMLEDNPARLFRL